MAWVGDQRILTGGSSLAGKVLIVTGATRGIGAAAARLFAACGATVGALPQLTTSPAASVFSARTARCARSGR